MKYDNLYLYSDGGCNLTLSKSVGAYAYIIAHDDDDKEADQIKLYEDSKMILDTTNNKMELLGAIEGFKRLEREKVEFGKLYVRSDSMYLIKGVTRWIEIWKQNNWKTKSGGDVKNQDYWLKLDYYKTKYNPIFEWVKGHETTKLNIECDAMCSKLIKEGMEQIKKE